jgi:alkanesulfonate monooxygenase SsuD/methylene tetrahydromethanopterin reductase-like flavin-dependent oxidoreductase (luciferase family)
MVPRMEFGIVLPQVQGATWDNALSTAKYAEEAGFDSLWVIDHVYGFPPQAGILEAWTMLAGLAPVTSRVGLGAQVFCQSFRSPALMAKMATTLQLMTAGRLHFLIGAGWFQDEYEAFGWEFPPPGVRVGQLRDTVKILKGMWNSGSEPFTYEGRHYSVSSVLNIPAPEPPIRLGIGGSGDRVLDLVAAEADEWNCSASNLPVYEERKRVLEDRLAHYGRDVRRTLQLVFSPGDRQAPAALQMFNPHLGLTGSIDQMVARVSELEALGVSGVFGMPAGRRAIDAMAEALPALRKGAG